MMRTKGGRKRMLIYAFPMMMDIVGGLIGFVAIVRASKLGASASMVAALGATSATAYLLTSFALRHFVGSRNSASFVITGCSGSLILSILFALVSKVPQMFPLMAFAGVNMACFFVGFQVFMTAVNTEQRQPPAYSAGMYTFSWSTGFAIGPFVSGFLMELEGARGIAHGVGTYIPCYATSGTLAVLTAVGVFLLRHHARMGKGVDAGGSEMQASSAYSKMPDMAWVGWVASGTGVMMFWLIMRIFPKEATVLGWADSTKGTVLFLLCITQAVVAFSLRRSKLWMYDWRRICIFAIFGVSGLVTLSLGKAPAAYCVGAVLFGIYSGAFFFYLVFHSLRHPNKSTHHISTNETIVGTASITGTLLGGVIADQCGFEMPYLMGVALVGTAVVFQIIMHKRMITPEMLENTRQALLAAQDGVVVCQK